MNHLSHHVFWLVFEAQQDAAIQLDEHLSHPIPKWLSSACTAIRQVRKYMFTTTPHVIHYLESGVRLTGITHQREGRCDGMFECWVLIKENYIAEDLFWRWMDFYFYFYLKCFSVFWCIWRIFYLHFNFVCFSSVITDHLFCSFSCITFSHWMNNLNV